MSFSTTNSRGQTYYLHGKDVMLKNGREQRIYYFAKEPKPRGDRCDPRRLHDLREHEDGAAGPQEGLASPRTTLAEQVQGGAVDRRVAGGDDAAIRLEMKRLPVPIGE